MTSDQIAILRTELETDPKGLGYSPFVSSGADGDLERLLNTVSGDRVAQSKLVGVTSIITWALTDADPTSGVTPWITINEGVGNPNPAISSLAGALIRITQPPFTEIDFSLPAVESLIGESQSAGLVTQSQHDHFLALSNVTPSSRSEELFGVGTQVSHLEIAASLGRGTI